MNESAVIRTLKLIIALSEASDAGSPDWWDDLTVAAVDAAHILDGVPAERVQAVVEETLQITGDAAVERLA